MQHKSHQLLRTFAGLTAIIVLSMFTACNPLSRKAPPIEQIFISQPSFASLMHLDQMPVDWENAGANAAAIEILISDSLKLENSNLISSLGLDPSHLRNLAVCAFFPEDQTLDIKTVDQIPVPDWITAFDLKRKLTTEELILKLNSIENPKINAKTGESLNGFQRIIIESDKGVELFSIALMSSPQSQLRVGPWHTLAASIQSPSTDLPFEEETLVATTSPHFWTHFRIPPEFKDSVEQITRELPFEPEVLLGGFESITTTYLLQSETLFTATALQFESVKQANTAFSYLQLGSSFAIKPYLRKETKGAANNFIKSIKLDNDGNYTKIYFSINQQDYEALEKLIQNEWFSLTGDFLFDLIP